ncbi:hypothetical protein CHS0354_024898 [Potamilus streckersoni]|uniref:Uncharacterized protein n=1 Tax=Potamilus streckersoni TaxID=2493646 RepID=A0AAE0SM45_9BIVA|nr:hypothetical protein CHS0354_024898 [Potamilus streckersoni]
MFETDKPARAVVGENTKIGWFYNQQGKNRTLLLIHPNQEVMVLVPPTNNPQIKSSFQHRLLYTGDTLRSFMLFTLLNISQSVAGLYTIETVHGNTIPGSKELLIEDTGLNNITTDEPPIAKSDQRHFLEKRETVSIVTNGTIRRPLTMHPLDEVRMDQSVTESDGVSSVILGLHYAASDDITAAHTECSSTYSQVQSEYDKVTINTGIDYNNSSDRFDRMASTVCNDNVLVGSSYVSTFVKTESIDEHEYNGNDQKQISQRGHVSYAKGKNIKKVSPHNTAPISRRNEHVQGIKEEDLCETATTPMNPSSTEELKDLVLESFPANLRCVFEAHKVSRS